MTSGEPCLVWIFAGAPILARYVRDETIEGIPCRLVRYFTVYGTEMENFFDRDLVQPMRHEVAMALDRGCLLSRQEGSA